MRESIKLDFLSKEVYLYMCEILILYSMKQSIIALG